MLLSNGEGGHRLNRILGPLSHSPQALLSHPQGRESQHLVSGAFLAAHQAPFSSCCALFSTRGLWRIKPQGAQRRESDNGRSPCGAGQGGQQAARPAPACSRLLSLRAPASPRQRQGLPTCPQGQLLNNPPGFVPRGKKTKPSENVQTKVVGTLWRSGAGGGGERQVGAVGTKTKAKIILQLLGSFVGFNRFPLALVLHPMPCGEG